MAECSITSVQVLNNPAAFTDPIVLEVQYECLSNLQDDLEWRVVYVGSAESDEYDQVLDSALLGPVQPGNFRFRMEAPAPDPARIPPGDLVGVTVLLLTGSYRGKEFVRVGYYVNVEYDNPELAGPDVPPPNPPIIDQLQRNIMTDHPRVTRFQHDFDNAPQPQPEPAEGDGVFVEEEPSDEAEAEYYEDDEEEDEEDGPMGDEEVDLTAEDLPPQQQQQHPPGSFFGVSVPGQPALGGAGGAGAAAAANGGGAAANGGGVDDMEL